MIPESPAHPKNRTRKDRLMNEEIKKLQTKIGVEVARLRTSRDKIREYQSEISSIVETADRAVDDLEDANSSMGRAVDSLSEML